MFWIAMIIGILDGIVISAVAINRAISRDGYMKFGDKYLRYGNPPAESRIYEFGRPPGQ